MSKTKDKAIDKANKNVVKVSTKAAPLVAVKKPIIKATPKVTTKPITKNTKTVSKPVIKAPMPATVSKVNPKSVVKTTPLKSDKLVDKVVVAAKKVVKAIETKTKLVEKAIIKEAAKINPAITEVIKPIPKPIMKTNLAITPKHASVVKTETENIVSKVMNTPQVKEIDNQTRIYYKLKLNEAEHNANGLCDKCGMVKLDCNCIEDGQSLTTSQIVSQQIATYRNLLNV